MARAVWSSSTRAVLALAIWSSSRSCLGASYLVKLAAVLARAIWSSSKSRFGASYLVKFNHELFGQVQRAVLARAFRCFGARWLVKFKELFWREQIWSSSKRFSARATWSSSKSCFGASLSGQVERSVLARAVKKLFWR